MSSRSAWSQTWRLRISAARGGCSDLGRVEPVCLDAVVTTLGDVPGGLAAYPILCCRARCVFLSPEGMRWYLAQGHTKPGEIDTVVFLRFFFLLSCAVHRAVVSNVI